MSKGDFRRPWNLLAASDDSAGALAVLLVVALTLGGGGVAYGLHNLAVQLIALAFLAFNFERVRTFWVSSTVTLRLLLGMTILLPLAQLLPLPPGLWEELPGRSLAAETRNGIGTAQWYPLTLDRARTFIAFTGLIAPAGVLALAATIRAEKLIVVGWMVVVMGLINFVIGIPQVLSPQSVMLIYPENPMPGVLFGMFANRNSTAMFLTACVILAGMLPLPTRWKAFEWGHWPTIATLSLGVILTQSRSGIALVAVSLILILAVSLRRTGHLPKLNVWTVAPALIVIGASALVVANGENRLSSAFERFNQTEEARYGLWEDSLHAVKRYWPVGSGIGTFDEVFQMDESLEHLTERPAGRAHNDFLELAMEAGAPGLLLALGWLSFSGILTFRGLRGPNGSAALAGAGILSAIALLSLVDYPLRNQALLCLAAFALALLLRAARHEGPV